MRDQHCRAGRAFGTDAGGVGSAGGEGAVWRGRTLGKRPVVVGDDKELKAGERSGLVEKQMLKSIEGKETAAMSAGGKTVIGRGTAAGRKTAASRAS